MTEYEKEKFEILEQIESIKERICTSRYKKAYWETIYLKDLIQVAVEKKIGCTFPCPKEL